MGPHLEAVSSLQDGVFCWLKSMREKHLGSRKGEIILNSKPVTLLIANSIDYAADLLVKNLGSEKVFRYNTDLWQQYSLLISDQEIELQDPTGRKASENSIVKVFRRSSMRASTLFTSRPLSDGERYAEEEVWMAMSDLLNIFWEQGKVVLNQPLATLRSCKLQQMRIARKYFQVTPFRFLLGRPEKLRPQFQSVAKSFSFKFADGIGFYARKVDEGCLDPDQPWFLTDYIEASEDVTVVVVRDELFAFSLDRKPFLQDTIDWRKAPTAYVHKSWRLIPLPLEIERKIFAFMAEIGLHYARLDFLREGENYTFLEANYAGEWGWLDPDNQNGLMKKILYEIDPETPLHGCPRPCWN